MEYMRYMMIYMAWLKGFKDGSCRGQKVEGNVNVQDEPPAISRAPPTMKFKLKRGSEEPDNQTPNRVSYKGSVFIIILNTCMCTIQQEYLKIIENLHG